MATKKKILKRRRRTNRLKKSKNKWDNQAKSTQFGERHSPTCYMKR